MNFTLTKNTNHGSSMTSEPSQTLQNTQSYIVTIIYIIPTRASVKDDAATACVDGFGNAAVVDTFEIVVNKNLNNTLVT